MQTTYTCRWLILAIASLGLGGSFAFLVGMSRVPVVSSFLPPDYFHFALVGHVIFAILFWLMISSVVVWSYFFTTPNRGVSYKFAVAGIILTAIAVLSGHGEAVLNNYVPMLTNPLFFLGLGLFFTGFAINAFRYLPEGLREIRQTDNILKNTLAAAVITAVVMIVSMAVSIVRFGGDMDVSRLQVFYERLFWIPGHIQQILNGIVLAAVWYALAGIGIGTEKNSGWQFMKVANMVLISSAGILLIASLIWNPLDKIFRVGTEVVYAFGLGVPIFLHMANAIYHSRPLEKMTTLAATIYFSMAIYTTGAVIAYLGLDNDTRIPAHYHGMVTALTLALMGFTYYLFKANNIKIAFPKIARLQPYIYGVGMLLFITGLFLSGVFGAPRKTFGVAWTDNPITLAALVIMGVGTLVAVVGGAIFVFYASVTLIKEKPVPLFSDKLIVKI